MDRGVRIWTDPIRKEHFFNLCHIIEINKCQMDNKILTFVILGIMLNTTGVIIMMTLQNMMIALPILGIGLVFTMLAVVGALKAKK